MKIPLRGSLKYPAAKRRGFPHASGSWRKDYNIQLRREGGHKPFILLEPLVENQRSGPALFQSPREFSAASQRQNILRRPKRSCRGARPGTFKTDLSQMKFGRTEVSVRGIMLIK